MPADHPGATAAEHAAALLTAAGMPRMPARVMMALVGSPDDGYTAAELADRLGVSAAAVSGAVQYLQATRMIQRLSRPGDRRDRYDLANDAWGDVIMAGVSTYAALADLMDQISDENIHAPVSVARARESAEFLRFLSRRLPDLVKEWRESQ